MVRIVLKKGLTYPCSNLLLPSSFYKCSIISDEVFISGARLKISEFSDVPQYLLDHQTLLDEIER